MDDEWGWIIIQESGESSREKNRSEESGVVKIFLFARIAENQVLLTSDF
jgi:hypothetical protein